MRFVFGSIQYPELWLGLLKEPVVLLFLVFLGAGSGGIGYIVFFRKALGPSDGDSKELGEFMLAATESLWFLRKTSVWSWYLRKTSVLSWLLPWRRAFDRDGFLEKLRQAEFKEFETTWQALRSLGWSGWNGSKIDPKWLFGVPGFLRRLRFIGRSIIDHELLHATQDYLNDGLLFQPPETISIWQYPMTFFLAEMEAHIFGGPLVAIG